MDYFAGVLNKLLLQAETALPSQKGELFFISLPMQTYRIKIQTKPSISRRGGRGLPADDKLSQMQQALLSASLPLEALATVCSMTRGFTGICGGPEVGQNAVQAG